MEIDEHVDDEHIYERFSGDSDSGGESDQKVSADLGVNDIANDGETSCNQIYCVDLRGRDLPPRSHKAPQPTKNVRISNSDYRHMQDRLRESVFDEDECDDFFEPFNARYDKYPRPSLAPYMSNSQIDSDSISVRHKCIEEIVSVHNNYVDILLRLHNNYMVPMKEQGVLDDNKIRQIFSGIKQILQLEREFQMYLPILCQEWEREHIIDKSFESFFKKNNVLRCYREYVINFKDILDSIKIWDINVKAFKAFLAERNVEDRLSISDLLIRPVQRFPQIRTTLEKLIKHTPQNHPDRLGLHRTLIYVQRIAYVVNEHQRNAEAKARVTKFLQDLQVRQNECEMRDLRILRKDEVTEYKQSPTPSVRELVLLNRYVFVCSSAHNGGNVRRTFEPLANVSVSSGASTSNVICDDEAFLLNRAIEEISNDDRLLSDIFSKIQQMTKCGRELMPVKQLQEARRGMQQQLKCKMNEKRFLSNSYIFLNFNDKQYNQTRVFKMLNSNVRRDWLHDFTIAKLQYEENNFKVWQSTAEDDPVLNQGLPLFVGHKATDLTCNKRHIYCAVEFEVRHANDCVVKQIWCCGEVGFVAVLTVTQERLNLSNAFSVGNIDFTCAAVVPSANDSDIWMAAHNGNIWVHSVNESTLKNTKQTIQTDSSVTSIKFLNDKIFVSTDCGNVFIYYCDINPEMKYNKPQLRIECCESVVQMAVFDTYVYVASGTRIYRINEDKVDREFCLIDPESAQADSIQHFVVCIEGFWFCCEGEAKIRFWHTTEQLLQVVDLHSCLRGLSLGPAGPSNITITALLLTDEQMWVGTSTGVIFLVNLQQSQCCPLAVGPPLAGRHAHCNAVDFMVAFQNIGLDYPGGQGCRTSVDSVPSPVLKDFDEISLAAASSSSDVFERGEAPSTRQSTSKKAPITPTKVTSKAPCRRTTFVLTFGAGHKDFGAVNALCVPIEVGILQWRRDITQSQ